jgi:hypothetical protein
MNSLKTTLSSLPPTLDETYYLILQRINQAEKHRVYHVLQWLCFSFGSLEARDVLKIYQIGDSIQPPFASDDALFRPADILGICHGLLVMVRCQSDDYYLPPAERETIELAHFSVKEYLQSARSLSWKIDTIPSHIYILRSSIAFLIYFVHIINDAEIDEDLRWSTQTQEALPAYLGTWIKAHLDCLTIREHPDLQESFRLVLHPDIVSVFGRLVLGEPAARFVFDLQTERDMWFAPLRSLAAAATLGLSMTVRWLLGFRKVRSQINSSARETAWATPLMWAVESRRVDAVETLVEAGANINQFSLRAGEDWSDYKRPTEWNALLEAVRTGQKQIVKVLLYAGADVNHISFDDPSVSSFFFEPSAYDSY